MELKDTVEMMSSTDYKERFKAEYNQLKIRVNKLSVMLNKYATGNLEFKPSCPISVLKEQLCSMRRYLCALEVRAQFEHIDIEG